METQSGISSMTIYEDESVYVRYGNGAQLRLSPCGCEFVLLKPAEHPGHRLQPPERVRQRTRFTVSSYKELLVAVLTFRNKYASRPYLPEELIPADSRKPFFSTDTQVQWPEWSSCDAELRSGNETVVRSKEGRAALVLSPSGQEFSVEFSCNLSRTLNLQSSVQGSCRDSDGSPGPQRQVSLNLQAPHEEFHQGGGRRGNESVRSMSHSNWIAGSAQPKAEGIYQSTAVVQNHSCSSVNPIWSYPLSLARHLWTPHLSVPDDIRAEEVGRPPQAQQRLNMSDVSEAERSSHLPQALPLTCPSPHRHRWRFQDLPVSEDDSDQDPHAELVKVMWCHGVTYRILSEPVLGIEVSPGDGSVIQSHGILNTYFTHHKPELPSGQVKEITYHLNNLPPDIPGQLYSICSVVSCASRILTCYKQAKQSLKLLVIPSCLQEVRESHSPKPESCEVLSSPVPFEEHVDVTQTVESRFDVVAAELEKIKRFNFLLENSQIPRSEDRHSGVDRISAPEAIPEVMTENCIAEALQRTSKAIQDIDAVLSAATLT